MRDNQKLDVQNALVSMLKPVFRILLKLNITYRQFAEASKIAAVAVSTDEYGIRGRPTNISRVAAMTGLTRKEVRRIRGLIDGSERHSPGKSGLERLVERWRTDKDFSTTRGPKKLEFENSENSFWDLVRKIGGDIPPGAYRAELKRLGLVKNEKDGRMILVREQEPGEGIVERAIELLENDCAGMMEAIARSLVENEEKGWAWTISRSNRIRKEDRKRLEGLCEAAISTFQERIDELFEAYEVIHGLSDDNESVGITVGSFMSARATNGDQRKGQ